MDPAVVPPADRPSTAREPALDASHPSSRPDASDVELLEALNVDALKLLADARERLRRLAAIR